MVMKIRVLPFLLFFVLCVLAACQSDRKTAVSKVPDPEPFVSNTKMDEPVDNNTLFKEEPVAEAMAKIRPEVKDANLKLEEEKLEEEKRKKARRKARAAKRAAEREKERQEAAIEVNTQPEELSLEEPLLSGKLQFSNRTHDFGRMKESDTLNYKFQFFNSGTAPIVISNVKASCGCTQTTYPKEPIMPGEQGAIGVTFDSKGKLGRQKPFISVTTNGNPKVYSLSLEGEVDTDRQ